MSIPVLLYGSIPVATTADQGGGKLGTGDCWIDLRSRCGAAITASKEFKRRAPEQFKPFYAKAWLVY